jgi:hypothetical protein
MRASTAVIACALIAASPLALLAAAQDAVDLDETRSAWHYRREVQTHGHCFASLPIPPELGARAAPDLADLRLLWPNGTEVPYVVDRRVARDVQTRAKGTLVDSRQERRRFSSWTVDLGTTRTFDVVTLDIPTEDFAKRLSVEHSADGRIWTTAEAGVGVFDRMWGERVHHARIDLAKPLVARYLRLTADDRHSGPIPLLGVTVSSGRRLDEETWSRSARLLAVHGGTVSRYRIGLASAYRFERLTLEADDLVFHRRVVLVESREVNGQGREEVLAGGPLFRLQLGDEAVGCESLQLAVRPPDGGDLYLDVHNGDSPPLKNPRISVSGVVERIEFPAVNPRLVLYYGNPRTRQPLYDVQALSQAAARRADCWETATVEGEADNPRFRPAAPLPFAPLTGAGLDPSAWRTLRKIEIANGEDIYTLTLAATDLALLREDLADLRLVDLTSRQVPFILESDASEQRVPLAIERRQAADAAAKEVGRRDRYRLSVPAVDVTRVSGLPLRGLVITFAEPFFSRHVVVTAAPEASARHPRVLFSGLVGRSANDSGPISLDLDGGRHLALDLEIDEGDNAPLTVQKAEAVVTVPRIAFKAGSGSYQVLLGNRAAEPPRYDLAALRREVLCYSARAVAAGPAQPNPAFRRGAAEFFRGASPTVVLWIALAAAVAALLYLTARILRPTDAARQDREP